MYPIGFIRKNAQSKVAQKMVDKISSYTRGYHMGICGNVPKDEIDIHKINAVLTGDITFLQGLQNGLKKLISNNKKVI